MTETHEHAVKRGKQSRTIGKDFERRVREDLEEKGWIVDRWTNNVEFDFLSEKDIKNMKDGDYTLPELERQTKVGKLVPAKAKWNNFTKSMMMGSGGFPDFIAFKVETEEIFLLHEVMGVECKTNDTLDRAEKDKIEWLLKNKIFSKILIASRVKENNRIKIVYREYGKDL